MKHRIQILLLFLAFSLNESVAVTYSDSAALAALQAEKMPLYIVDGKIGVNPAELPPADSIASTTILTKEEAVELYGERAKNGVFIVKTNEFVRTHGGGDKTQYDSNAPKGGHKKGTPSKLGRWINKMTGGNTFLGIILCLIIVLAIMALPTIIPRLLTRNKKHKQGRKAIYSNYDPGTFDAEGVRFEAVKQLKNYLLLFFCVIITCMFIVILFKHIPNISSVTSIIFTLVYFGAFITLFLILFVNQYRKLKSYIIIDEIGLRGILPCESKRFTLKPTFRDVNISWEDIKKAEIEGYTIIFHRKDSKIPDDIVDFAELDGLNITEEEIENSIEVCDMSLFPLTKVRDCINYFYGCKMGISKQPTLVKPDPFEKSNLLTIILIILAVALLTYLGRS